ncbi:MAG: hypothetical protein KJ620_09530 [Candidatus Edwardsbacteria bacterium]|nr:hypothetical protein [Candidatus Edwardsbacteria bacterium]MBU1576204.1 hypothetical protein [Candidatus Edwardsbacteria bacterium]MBU2462857.1 hypothetical protein [Candidatus Edwardsbacteria bacterium]MBU2593488.1 hypothetical protein [Candidatus Edwardsbacteria bacterium]
MNDIGACDCCGNSFVYDLIHNGFNDSAYAYCDQCGMLAILNTWEVPEGIELKIHKIISPDIELLLAPCQCGGKFKADASPRCPHCKTLLSADKSAEWIEKNAPGTIKGWRWQRCWDGMYAISIEQRLVKDNWKKN